jgi:hypothetical protein
MLDDMENLIVVVLVYTKQCDYFDPYMFDEHHAVDVDDDDDDEGNLTKRM